ncbi:MAG: hypothetical protein ACYTFA_10405 [Planctomycetota bacterium]|jgi:hypothetical protein
MASDCIHATDDNCDIWQNAFARCVNVHLAELGLGDLTAVNAARRPERAHVSGRRHPHAVRDRLRGCRRGQGGALHVPLRQHERRRGTTERDSGGVRVEHRDSGLRWRHTLGLRPSPT